jgi:hypothetical protein
VDSPRDDTVDRRLEMESGDTMIPTASGHPPQERKGSGWKLAFCLLFGAVVLVGLAGLGTVVIGGKLLVSFGISSDITEYISVLERAEIDPAMKDEAIERLERIRERARKGQHVGLWRWVDYDESIQNLIADGEVTDYEFASLVRELDRLEQAK